MTYIWQRSDWPRFRWDERSLSPLLAAVRFRQGRLMGRMEGLGFVQRDEAVLRTLTDDVVKSSEIEGEILDVGQVRSSVARHLGLDAAGLPLPDRRVDGVVQMTLEATRNFARPLTSKRLFDWQAALFVDAPTDIRIGAWRDDAKGPMRVISGAIGRERVHFEAPPAASLESELAAFFESMNRTGDIDAVVQAAIAHLWFVTIHPFDDGNGRVARAIADWSLARAERLARRYYSLSAQICRERNAYYEILEKSQKGSMDITGWIRWFLECLDRAMAGTEDALERVFNKDRFWRRHAETDLNERQRLVLNRLLDGPFEGKLTSSKWAKLAKCSQDTAYRDINQLIEHEILVKEPGGGRNTSYRLVQSDGADF